MVKQRQCRFYVISESVPVVISESVPVVKG